MKALSKIRNYLKSKNHGVPNPDFSLLTKVGTGALLTRTSSMLAPGSLPFSPGLNWNCPLDFDSTINQSQIYQIFCVQIEQLKEICGSGTDEQFFGAIIIEIKAGDTKGPIRRAREEAWRDEKFAPVWIAILVSHFTSIKKYLLEWKKNFIREIGGKN